MGNLFVSVERAAKLPGEAQKWIALFNGVQQGGFYDKSGAGNREFDSEVKAREWVSAVLFDIPFDWADNAKGGPVQ